MNDSFTLIATVSPEVDRYIDSNICDRQYCYFVEAVHPYRDYRAHSNTACDTPVARTLSIDSLLRRTTVINNEATLTEWEAVNDSLFDYYVIDRYSDSIGWLFAYATTKDTRFIDEVAVVNERSYNYQVRLAVFCGNTGNPTNLGTSIFITAMVINDKVRLRWNRYRNWPTGVNNYHLELRNKSGAIEEILVRSGSDTSYTDQVLSKQLNEITSAYEDVEGAYCYRVFAVSGNEEDTSYSNITCAVIPSRVFVPNAFSPNNDGLNDVFKVNAQSILNLTGEQVNRFEMRIFDRWGELLFETNDYHEGWDGTYKGDVMPVGAYVYQIKATGYDDQTYLLRGTITIVR